MPYKNKNKRRAWTRASRRKKAATSPEWKDKRLSAGRIYYNSHKDEVLAQKKVYRHLLKREVLKAYGNQCKCCGELKWQFLCIDHIDGGGSKHRAGLAGKSVYQWLKDNKYPKGFQVLCRNCNAAKSECSVCPHKRNKVRRIRIHINKHEMAKGAKGRPWTISTSKACISAKHVTIIPNSITEYKPELPSNPKAFICVDGELEDCGDGRYIVK